MRAYATDNMYTSTIREWTVRGWCSHGRKVWLQHKGPMGWIKSTNRSFRNSFPTKSVPLPPDLCCYIAKGWSLSLTGWPLYEASLTPNMGFPCCRQQSNKDFRLASSRPSSLGQWRICIIVRSTSWLCVPRPSTVTISPTEGQKRKVPSTAFGHTLLTVENLLSRPHCPSGESGTKTSKLVKHTSSYSHKTTLSKPKHLWASHIEHVTNNLTRRGYSARAATTVSLALRRWKSFVNGRASTNLQ